MSTSPSRLPTGMRSSWACPAWSSWNRTWQRPRKGPWSQLSFRPLIKPGTWLPMNVPTTSVRPRPGEVAGYLSFSHPGLKLLDLACSFSSSVHKCFLYSRDTPLPSQSVKAGAVRCSGISYLNKAGTGVAQAWSKPGELVSSTASSLFPVLPRAGRRAQSPLKDRGSGEGSPASCADCSLTPLSREGLVVAFPHRVIGH